MRIFSDLFYSSSQFETSNELEQVCTSEERQAFNEKLDEVRNSFGGIGVMLVMKLISVLFFL